MLHLSSMFLSFLNPLLFFTCHDHTHPQNKSSSLPHYLFPQQKESTKTHKNLTQTIPPPHPKMAGVEKVPTQNACRSVLAAVTVLLLLAGITALIIYLVYRPEHPRFSIIGAALYDLNATSPPLISTTMQFTLLIRNPNRRVSIYYDRLSAFVSYRNQAITPPASLPSLFHETRSTVELSPVLGGAAVPVAAEVGNWLEVDEAYGVVGLRVMVLGRLRYKAGAIRTGHYGLYVRCDVLVGLKKGFEGQVPLLASPPCKVDV